MVIIINNYIVLQSISIIILRSAATFQFKIGSGTRVSREKTERCERILAMNTKILLLCATIAIASAGTAYAQVHPNVGPNSPDRANQDLANMQQIQVMDGQRRLDDMRRRGAQSQQSEDGNGTTPSRDPAVVQAQVAKFMEAIRRRKNRFADFDLVVLHSKTPMTPEMLGFMAESPYAADVAYYLGKHPEQSGEIAQMQPDEAGLAVRQLAANVAAENSIRK